MFTKTEQFAKDLSHVDFSRRTPAEETKLGDQIFSYTIRTALIQVHLGDDRRRKLRDNAEESRFPKLGQIRRKIKEDNE